VDDSQLTSTREAWQTGTSLGDDQLKEEVEAMLGRDIDDGAGRKRLRAIYCKGADQL
jgi:hypothetical protein